MDLNVNAIFNMTKAVVPYMKENKGGVIILDEAYTLASEGQKFKDDALGVILKEMEKRDIILDKVNELVCAHRKGLLGGEKMPEDENPHLEKGSKQNYMYFTLPMALNYQRNSYVLWECANRMYEDKEAQKVFDSKEVCIMQEQRLRDYLVEYRVALQPNKQPEIWKKICETIENKLEGDIRNLFIENEYSVKKIKEYIQKNKKDLSNRYN